LFRAFATKERAPTPGASDKDRLKQRCQWYWLFNFHSLIRTLSWAVKVIVYSVMNKNYFSPQRSRRCTEGDINEVTGAIAGAAIDDVMHVYKDQD